MKPDEQKELNDLLTTPLNVEDGNSIATQLSEVEAWSSFVAIKHRASEKELSEMKNKFLMPKDKGITEMDREIHLDAAVREFKEKSDLLNDYQEIIKRRISLGQTLLKNLKSERDSGLSL